MAVDSTPAITVLQVQSTKSIHPQIEGDSATMPSKLSPKSDTTTASSSLHPAVYVGIWIFFSSAVILYNKYLLDTAGFRYPMALTTWHLIFATIATHVLKRTTTLLDGAENVRMTRQVYLRAIVPIGAFFSASLICSNQAYLYLSVAFIQMVKASTPVAVLIASWILAVEEPSLTKLGNVSAIVVGVIIASYGEIEFHVLGFIFQAFGIAFEATRLVMVQRLLSSAEYKMDPLVSLYYFAPICALFNGIMCILFEGSSLTFAEIQKVGFLTLLLNASTALCLNISVVFLIGKTSSLVLTLSGVLKDVILVSLSILIWQTRITSLQFLGYAIALSGLVYYKIGGQRVQDILSYGRGLPRAHQDLLQQSRGRKPAAVAVLILISIGTLIFLFQGAKTRPAPGIQHS